MVHTSRANMHEKILRQMYWRFKPDYTGVEIEYSYCFSSQIYCILVQDNNLVTEYKIKEKSNTNTSAHSIVKMEITTRWQILETRVPRTTNQNTKCFGANGQRELQQYHTTRYQFNSIEGKYVNIHLKVLMETLINIKYIMNG